VRTRPTIRIIALAVALATIPAAALADSNSGTTGPTGATGHTGTTGATGSTGHHVPPPHPPPPKPTPKPPPLPAAEIAHLRRVMAAAMKPLGPHSGAYAVDLQNGQVLFDDAAAVPRNPASVEKLYTLTTALDRFGLGGTLQTDVYGTGKLERDGLYRGTIYLRGGGDPTFGSAAFIRAYYGAGTSVQALARTLVERTGISKIKGSVAGDESYFDSLRGGPSTGFAVDPNLVGQLSALAFNRGQTGRRGSPAAYAAFELAGALRRQGVVVTGRSHAAIADLLSAKLLASIDSPPMATLARLTALPSDDFFAEMILKALGARFGTGGTTAAGAAVVSQFLRTIHLTPAVADGSGLSRADRTSPLDVVTLLRDLSPGGLSKLQPLGAALRDALPVVSESGTLAMRMHHTAASGRCIAKTGTLSDASDLAGWCNGVFAFAFLMNHVDVYAAQNAQDRMTIALAKLSVPAASKAPARRSR
jgi:D-alanyl-D-alanine carboxypeptidase/D-alanyl-D-alanine-endopeptidase (penicillin-binding protein 4)